jgi:hypothetical protein
MTKKEEQTRNIARQREAIGKLYELCGGGASKQNRISNRLLSIERKGNALAVDYANGIVTTEEWEIISDNLYNEVQALFNHKLEGLKINGDARGYTLKIDDAVNRELSDKGINLHRDWGGYGILGPTF